MQRKMLNRFVALAVGGLLASVAYIGCTGPQGPAGTPGKVLYDTLHIMDTVLIKDTVIHKDTTVVSTHDTTTVNDTVIHRDTTVITDTSLMNASCLVCHNTPRWDSITTEFKMSYHFTRGVVNNSSRFCERCHTSEGFQEITTNGQPVCAAAIPNATAIGCVTCHQMKGLDFADTAACILRTISPVVLNYNNAWTVAGGWTTQKTTDFGETSNLCGTCHQIRGATSYQYTDTTTTVNGAPNTHKMASVATESTFAATPYFPVSQYATTDSVAYMSGRTFAVHDGNQTNVDKGMNAYEYAGITAGKDSSSGWHHYNWACIDCHQGTQFNPADSTGGHTFRINRNDPKCTGCHNLTTQISADSGEIATLLNTLGGMLVTRKVFSGNSLSTYKPVANADFYGTILAADSADSGKVYATTTSANSVTATTGILNYDNLITWGKNKAWATAIGRKWTGGELGAAYNYTFVYNANYVHAYGIHNAAYEEAVLTAAIAWLSAH